MMVEIKKDDPNLVMYRRVDIQSVIDSEIVRRDWLIEMSKTTLSSVFKWLYRDSIKEISRYIAELEFELKKGMKWIVIEQFYM